MRIATVGLTAVALALTVASCADGCSAREDAARTAPDVASPEPASESGSGSPVQSAPDAGSEAAPESLYQPGETVPPEALPLPPPPTKPEPEPGSVEGMKSAATDAPPLGEMQVARAVGKLGPPVDVRYLVSGVVAKDQPVTLRLAFVPRLDGRNLRVEFPDTAGVVIETGSKAVSAQKASKSDVLRHTLLVTPTAADSGAVRAVVSIDVGASTYAGVISIPVGDRAQQGASKKTPQG